MSDFMVGLIVGIFFGVALSITLFALLFICKIDNFKKEKHDE